MPLDLKLPLNENVILLLDKCKHLNHLKQVQAFLLTLGHGQTHFFAFKLVRFCALAVADLRYARLIFDSLKSPNIFLYTAMMTSYTASSEWQQALLLFDAMLRNGRPRPNHFIYPLVLKSCSEFSSPWAVRSIHTQVLKLGYGAHSVVQTALVDSYSKSSDVETSRCLFDEMTERNVVSWTAMVSGYAKVGLIGEAMLLFEEMPVRDVPSWNAVIAGCTQNGFFSEAISLFQQLLLTDEKPNDRTVVCALSSCAHLGMLRSGKWIHGYINRNNIPLTSFVTNALLDMYGKCGSLNAAWVLFDLIPKRSLTSWNSMINCLALHGRSESAIALFNEMEGAGVKPDEISFVGVLNACTHAGLVDEGCHYFLSMNRDHKIDPRIEHYGCIIDLLGRVGRFEEALDVVRGMRMEPDEVVWGALLNGSRVYGNTELAEFSVLKLLEIDPKNAGYGVMLANIYSECGRWEDMGKLRKKLKEKGAHKTPGCSWIEVESEVHKFHSADDTHPKAERIYEALKGLFSLTIQDYLP